MDAKNFYAPMTRAGRIRVWLLHQTTRLPFGAQRVALRLLGY
jgi:hypothetical protein